MAPQPVTLTSRIDENKQLNQREKAIEHLFAKTRSRGQGCRKMIDVAYDPGFSG
jgi:hypothetical protein